MKRLKISFVVHGLNEERVLSITLKRLDEIRKESKIRTELIFVDEGSTDLSVQIAKKYVDRIFRLKGTPIFGRTRDFGCKKSKGDIVVSIDSENLLPYDAIEKILKAFEDKKVVAMTCDVYVFPWEETLNDKIFQYIRNRWYWFLCASGILPMGRELHAFRKSAFQKVNGYNEKLAACEDTDIFLRLSKIGKVVYMKDLKIFESPARYRKYGYLRTYLYWTFNSLKYFLGMPVDKYERVVH